MATIFQRSSQGSSVESNTIKVHDPADKILRESQATLASWSKRLNAEDARAERNEQYRQKKFQEEKENRATNRQWEKTPSNNQPHLAKELNIYSNNNFNLYRPTEGPQELNRAEVR